MLHVCMQMCQGTQQTMLCHRRACASADTKLPLQVHVDSDPMCFSWIASKLVLQVHADSDPMFFSWIARKVALQVHADSDPMCFSWIASKLVLQVHADSDPMFFFTDCKESCAASGANQRVLSKRKRSRLPTFICVCTYIYT